MSKGKKSSPREQGQMSCVLYASTSADACSRSEGCPFPEGSEERREWLAGWDEVYKARLEQARNNKTMDDY